MEQNAATWAKSLPLRENNNDPSPENPDTTIGASEIATIMGLSPWQTPYGLWAHKNGLTRPDTKTLNRGRRLERVVLEIAADELGVEVQPGLQHPGPSNFLSSEPWATARPDAYAIIDGQRATIEAKTANKPQEWGLVADLDAPLHYVVQVLWQGLVTGADLQVLAGLMLQDVNTKIYPFPRNPTMEKELLQRAKHWREKHLLSGRPPELDGSDDARRWLTNTWSASSGTMRQAGPGETQLLVELATVKAELKKLEELEGTLSNQVRQLIGPDDGIAWDGGKATWKWQNGATRLDTARMKAEEPSLYARFAVKGDDTRVLRVTENKPKK